MRALVVGGSSDIGASCAHMLTELGHQVLLWGRDQPRLAAAATACDATTRVMDLTDRADLTAAAVEAGDLHAVVWAAGVFDWGPADRADPAAWGQLLDVNLTAAALGTRLLLPGLLRTAPSALVYIGSTAARHAFPDNAAYVASKHGLAGLVGGVWADVRDRGVRVSLVSPGLVSAGAGLRAPLATEHPEAMLRPSDVAAAVRFVLTFPGPGCPVEVVLANPRG